MVTALILAGGTGSRLGGDIPKQYLEVKGLPLISYCIRTFRESGDVDGIWVVAAKEWYSRIREWAQELDTEIKGFSLPGDNRQLSIYAGIKDIQEALPETEYVLIHDAARPLLSGEEIADCVRAVSGHEGVLPVLPMKDTVYISTDHNRVTGLLERSDVFAGQAPELFLLERYIQANEKLIHKKNRDREGIYVSEDSPIWKINGSAEPAIMDGMDIVMIPGDERNFKITTESDFKRFIQIINEDHS